MKHRILLCPPKYFAVSYVINPWMEGNIDKAINVTAQGQWENLKQCLSKHADVSLMEPFQEVPDLVFTANAGIVFDNVFLCSRFLHKERQLEEPHFIDWFKKQGFEIKTLPEGVPFEGAGDALFDRELDVLWAGYGFRSELESHAYLSEVVPAEVLSLRLVDPRFYHLDTCLCPLEGGYLLYFPDAFDQYSNQLIQNRVPKEKLIPVSESDATKFSCNAVNVGNIVILNDCSTELETTLEDIGFVVEKVTLTEFMKSGGAAKCLTLRLDEPMSGSPKKEAVQQTQRVIFEGHLIDSGVISSALDLITELGGSFTIDSFDLGQKRQSQSSAQITVLAPSKEVLERILDQLMQLGGSVPEVEIADAVLTQVTQQGVAPDDFYSTTIFPTEVRVKGNWLRASKQRMDATVVVQGGTSAECVLIRDLKVGDKVVSGIQGVRTIRAPKPRSPRQVEEFSFMGSAISSERKVELVVEEVAWKLRVIKDRGGKVVVSAGPVVVHTGGGAHLSWLIREGFITGLLGGNAIAVHDMEQAVMGTSLGVDLARGITVEGGHKHHLKVINKVRGYGSIKEAVDAGYITTGIMYECIKHDVPFALAGSVRDDGPLPDTHMDLIKAQEEYARIAEGAEMILLLSSMLQSIGVGNMTPAGVKLICVDINPAVVTKLNDRGSVESTGVVTDVGLFLGLLVQKLKDLSLPGE